jgi:hypothetical protein
MNCNHKCTPKRKSKKKTFGDLSKISISQTFPFFNKSTKKVKIKQNKQFEKINMSEKGTVLKEFGKKKIKERKWGMRG